MGNYSINWLDNNSPSSNNTHLTHISAHGIRANVCGQEGGKGSPANGIRNHVQGHFPQTLHSGSAKGRGAPTRRLYCSSGECVRGKRERKTCGTDSVIECNRGGSKHKSNVIGRRGYVEGGMRQDTAQGVDGCIWRVNACR